MSLTTNGSTTTGIEAVERARGLHDLVNAGWEESEELGKLTKEIDDALHETGLYGMWVPKSLGGLELDPISSLQVIEAVTYAQPSAGWVLMAAALSIGVAGSYLSDEAVGELFGGARMPVIAGQGTRPGNAKPVDGGHDITGSWSFASGIKHAQYIHTAVVTEDTGEFRICVVPIEKATLIDNWDVLGLRATGSIDYTMEDVFVPEGWSHFGLIEESPRGGDLYKLGIIQIALICHSGWALGMGRRLLDELASNAQSKAGRPGQLVESDAFQIGFAEQEGKYRAARAFVFETWNDVWSTLTSGGELTTRQRTLLRIALTNATWTAHEVSAFVYKNGGTTALRSGTIQRLFRDMHAGTQHITSAPGVIKEAGRELAGLAPGHEWVFLGLADPSADGGPASH
jgi:indole-3-acetate monooxygenase